MKIPRRYWLLGAVFGVVALIGIVLLGIWGVETESDRRTELLEEIRIVDAMCDQWAIETRRVTSEYIAWEYVMPYGPTPGWNFQFPSFRDLASGKPDAWRSLPRSIRYRKQRHFYPDGMDPFGNPLILNKVFEGAAIHPRTLFHLAATPEGRALLPRLEPFFPFSRNVDFAEYFEKEKDLVRTIERAVVFGQAAALKNAIADALSENDDFAATVGPGSYNFVRRSASVRRALLKPAGLLREVDSILAVLEDSKLKSEPPFANTFFDKHLENYQAVRHELEQLQKNLGQ